MCLETQALVVLKKLVRSESQILVYVLKFVHLTSQILGFLKKVVRFESLGNLVHFQSQILAFSWEICAPGAQTAIVGDQMP